MRDYTPDPAEPCRTVQAAIPAEPARSMIMAKYHGGPRHRDWYIAGIGVPLPATVEVPEDLAGVYRVGRDERDYDAYFWHVEGSGTGD